MTRIVHLSDLHLGEDKTGAFFYRRRLAINRISEESPDAIVVSGDLVDFCSKKSFQSAYYFITELKQNFPVICVPGNTDHSYFYEKKRLGLPRKRKTLKVKKVNFFSEPKIILDSHPNFNKIIPTGFSFHIGGEEFLLTEVLPKALTYKRGFNLNEYSKYFGEGDPYLKLGELSLFGFNSYLDKVVAFHALCETDWGERKIFLTKRVDGFVSESRLEKNLQNKKSNFNIAVMHHPLFFIPGSNPVFGEFFDGENLAKKLLENNIQFSLCGHKHLPGIVSREIISEKYGKIPFHVCASGTLFDDDIKLPFTENTYNILNINGNSVSVEYRELFSGHYGYLGSFDLN